MSSGSMLCLLLLWHTNAAVAKVLVGAHYFSGWTRTCVNKSSSACYSHFHGYTPTGQATSDWFPYYAERTPLLGLLDTDEATVMHEISAAEQYGLDFFDILYYDGGADCGHNSDPSLHWCLDNTLAFMLNSSEVWSNTTRMRFFVTYSNDIDRYQPNALGPTPEGDARWSALLNTWTHAMQHPRYLAINSRPVFKILIPDIFVLECGGNATFASYRLEQLRQTAQAAGLANPLIGGGWENPSIPDTGTPSAPRPHPRGYMLYTDAEVACPGGCTIAAFVASSVTECQSRCNVTGDCRAVTLDRDNMNCSLLNTAGPGTYHPRADTYVRVQNPVLYDWTGSYNAAPPVCPSQPNWECKRYHNSWFPNATPSGAKIFPYRECGDYQGQARTNHSRDRVPYLPNLIAGFDPRPWQEHGPSFAMPTQSEWEGVLRQIKSQCEDPSNRFGFPDVSQPQGYQPAFNIYAWNEFAEGGIIAPTKGDGFMKLETIKKVFGSDK